MWLMTKLLNEKITKHHLHLLYLSKEHDLSLCKLKITGKPVSFLFVLNSLRDYYIVWETHNTMEATYLWRVKAESVEIFHERYEKIESTITLLRMKNKRAYRNENKDNLDFKIIEHDYSLANNGFDKWKSQIETFIS
jgi:hypothetical protein